MASPAPASAPVEQSHTRPSFAKVAASALTSRPTKETAPKARPPVATPRNLPLPQTKRPAPTSEEAAKMAVEKPTSIPADGKVSSTAVRTREWTDAAIQSAAPSSEIKEEVPNGSDGRAQPSVPVKVMVAEDSSTQVSSSDGSGKPPSIDGKSVASTNTFALDEKESLRPDDSASLRAVEEEDVTSPPESVITDSRHGSDYGANRAFHDQLREIAVMNSHRGVPPGRFPTFQNGGPSLYDPVQIANGARPISQPVGNIATRMNDDSSLAPVPNEKLLEAARSPRDRLFIVKLEEDFTDFVKNPSESEYNLPNTNTFYRMLAHKLADYFMLGHRSDDTKTGVKITRTPYCRIPPPISKMDESKDAGIPPVEIPVRKIMRRDDGKSGTNTTSNSQNASKATSEAGSNDGNDKDKGKLLTREEKEARYQNARRKIFGDSESEENQKSETGEGAGSSEEKDKEASRSNSAAGKKKNKKQRNYDDDDFHSRSSFNVYYPQQQHPDSLYNSPNSVYYSASPGMMSTPQYSSMHSGLFPSSGSGPYSSMASGPTPPSSNVYPAMVPPQQYGWTAQQYQAQNGSTAYANHAPMHNGHDLSHQFQRGMSSFQTAGMPSQVTPTMGNVPMASYDPYSHQPAPGSSGWAQPPQQPSYPPGGAFQQNGNSNRPMSAPQQGPPPNTYPYGQFPPTSFNGRPNPNQHPIPGSYNRQQFNPQSQTFVPGGPHAPYQVQNGHNHQYFGGMYQSQHTMVVNNNPPVTGPAHYMGRPVIPAETTPPFGSPQSMNNYSPAMHRNPSQPGEPKVNSISKYGTPSNLPQKPPAPAPVVPQGPKLN